ELGDALSPTPPLPEGGGERNGFSPSREEGEREGEARVVRESKKQEDEPLVTRPSSLVTLPVPFVSQAPFRVWDLPYKEFCEEASVFTLHLWKQGKRTPPADELDRSLKDIQAWETANLRTWEDTTAEETASILREKFGYVQTWVVRNVTIDVMKAELAKGRPIIVPAAGRELSSPYYKPPGPLYHMLVVIGYDDASREFITNDVGTNTKGAGFRFTYDDLYGAMGDWDPARGEPDTSQKVMIVVE
ncbi:C39 family peptidase, partial [Candidatus Uhrbacteria bacterium]|nr:C39 family peptidase [Candidatus Uhrbacteria bacterium]